MTFLLMHTVNTATILPFSLPIDAELQNEYTIREQFKKRGSEIENQETKFRKRKSENRKC